MIPIVINIDELEHIRDELDHVIQMFKKLSEISIGKQTKVKELIGKEKGSKVMDILFSEVLE